MVLKEKIILSNSFNEAEFLRCIAKNGSDTLGVRVSNDIDLCSYILMKNGKKMSGTYINDKEADFIYFSFLGGVLNDSSNIRSAINSFRDCVIGNALDEMNDYLSGDFSKKKKVIIDAYKKYIDYKKDNNLYDKHDMINFIIENNLKVSDIDVEYFKEFDITKLMSEMINNVFDYVKRISIKDYFKNENNHKGIIKAYGKVNEIDYIFNKINDERIKIDECQIILLDNSYLTEVLLYAKKYDIPYTSTIGIPFIETNVGRLLKALIDLNNQGYGVDAYKKLFSNDAFDSSSLREFFKDEDGSVNKYTYPDFIKYIGWLRIRFYENINVENVYDKEGESLFYDALTSFNNDIKSGIISFINKYVKEDFEKENALNKINDILELKKKYNADIDDFKLLESLLSSNIMQSVSNNGMLHISGLDKAFSSIRKHNFIVGLDDNYPGSPKENYLIYDDEYKMSGSNIYLSTEIIESKINIMKTFIDLCSNVYLIYSFYDLVDLKDKNPSSVIYDEKTKGTKETSYSYINSNLNENRKLIEEKSNNKIAKDIILNNSNVSIDSNNLFNKEYGPSAISDFFDNKITFILAKFFGISIDDPDDMYSVMSSIDKGNIIHKITEGFEKNKITKEEFVDKAKKEYEKYLKMRPAIINTKMNVDKNIFLADIENLYNMDPGNIYVSSEEWLKGKISKIVFKGKYDRLEKTNDDKYILVDYKTGNTMKHKNNDVSSCIQGLIYAYLIETLKNIKVDRIEFRYPHISKTAYINYNDDTKQGMLDLVNKFEEAITNNDFSCKDGLSKYKYYDKYKVLLSLFEEVCK